MPTITKDKLDQLTPQESLEILKDGNQRFVSNLRRNRDLLRQAKETAAGQYPFAVVLSCIDSRTSSELIFDLGMGHIFSVRIAGNVVNNDILGSIEYACKVTGSKLIMVLGHTRCGAVTGACSHVQMGHLTGLLEKIQPSVEKVKKEKGDDLSRNDFVDEVARENVLFHMEDILNRSSILRELYSEGKIGVVGGMYDVETGEVEMINEKILEHATT